MLLRSLLSILPGLVPLLGIPVALAADAPPRPDPVRTIPVQCVLPRSGPGTAAVWDTLVTLEFRSRWADTDSVATALLAELEAAPGLDSLEWAYARAYVANSVIKRRVVTDPRGFANLEDVIAVRERHLGPRDSLAVWCRVMAATHYPEAGRADLALVHAERAIANVGPGGVWSEPLRAQAHLCRGIALAALRRLDEAPPEFEEAIRLRESVSGPDAFLLVPMHAEYGTCLVRAGEFDAAREELQRAVAILETRAHMARTDFLANCLSRLSTLENRTGNIAESLDLAQRALEAASAYAGEESIMAVRMRTIVSYRLLDLGDHRGAADLLRGIVPAMEAGLGPAHPNTINARLALIEALVEIGEFDEAQPEIAAARTTLEQEDPLANTNWTYFLQLVGDLEAGRGNLAAARDTFALAIAIERDKGDPSGENLGQLLAHLLETATPEDDPAFVERIGREVDALRETTSVHATPIWAPLVASRAGAEARVGLGEAAWEHALLAEELGRTRFTYEVGALPDARALRLAGHLGAPCDLLVACLEPGENERAAIAWDRLVRWRGRVRDEIAHRRLPVDADDPGLVAAHAEWTHAQRGLAQLVVSGAANPEDPDTAERFETARRTAEDLERRYMRLAHGTPGAADAIDLAAVLDAVGEGRALVAFATADDGRGAPGFGALVARGDTDAVTWIPLGSRSEVELAVAAWNRELGRAATGDDPAGEGEAEARRLGAAVRRAVWDPLLSVLAGVSDVVLIPEGPVIGLPWLALPEGTDRYLADTGTTIRVLEAERDVRRAPASPAAGLLAVGDPDFDRAGAPPAGSEGVFRAWRCTGGESLALPPLPASRAEAEDIAAGWSGEAVLLVGGDAGEAAVKQSCPGRSVIHLATHGVVVDDTCFPSGTGTRGVGGLAPLPGNAPEVPDPDATYRRPWLDRQVWLALAGANRTPEEAVDENEGLLTAQEVITLDLRGTEWVVLSACRSAGASTWSREGVLGMQRAFRLAGARAVIASHWSVGDASTREWMAALYEARGRGRSAGEAVGDACRARLAALRAEGRSTHPGSWAAFTATGD